MPCLIWHQCHHNIAEDNFRVVAAGCLCNNDISVSRAHDGMHCIVRIMRSAYSEISHTV